MAAVLSSEEAVSFPGKTRGPVVRPDLSYHSPGLGKPCILSEPQFPPLKMRIALIATPEIAYEAHLK